MQMIIHSLRACQSVIRRELVKQKQKQTNAFEELQIFKFQAPIGRNGIPCCSSPCIPCILGARRAINLRHGLTSKIASRPSSETPRDSGWKSTQTSTVTSAHAPKRKYGPEEDLERNSGVEKAMTQFTAYGHRT